MRYTLSIISSMIFCVLYTATVYAAPTVYISAEAGVPNAGAAAASATGVRMDTERLADTWRADTAANTCMTTRGVLKETVGINAQTISLAGVPVTISLRDVNLSIASSTGTLPNVIQTLSGRLSMQDDAPFPESLYSTGTLYWNEGGGSPNSNNAIYFEFGTGVSAFGAYIGDLETRYIHTDPTIHSVALLRLFDSAGVQIGTDTPILPDDTLLTAQGYTQMNCGGINAQASITGCGNETTRWIGFTNYTGAMVHSMMIIVGDDDDGDDGKTEHLSMVAPTIATQCVVPIVTPVVYTGSISGTVYVESLSGDTTLGPVDTAFSGVTISLYSSTGMYITGTVSSVSGTYMFADISPSTYTVSYSGYVLPPRYSPAYTSASGTVGTGDTISSISITGTVASTLRISAQNFAIKLFVPLILANTSTQSYIYGSGGVHSLLSGDTYSGSTATLSGVDISITNSGGISGLTLSGEYIVVPAGTASGVYTVAYTLVDKGNSANTSSSTAIITVLAPLSQVSTGSVYVPPQIVARADTGTYMYGSGGTVYILSNDTISGSIATLSGVSVSLVSTGMLTGATLSGAMLVVPASTLSGVYTVVYRLTDVYSTANTAIGSVVVTIYPRPVAVVSTGATSTGTVSPPPVSVPTVYTLVGPGGGGSSVGAVYEPDTPQSLSIPNILRDAPVIRRDPTTGKVVEILPAGTVATSTGYVLPGNTPINKKPIRPTYTQNILPQSGPADDISAWIRYIVGI